MKTVFADTLYWVAIARPNDSWGESARLARSKLGEVQLVTTEGVLVEFLSSLAKGTPAVRLAGVAMVRAILADPQIRVIPQSHEGFLAGLVLFENRPDKGYSLVDCISMNTMNELGIQKVLTNDSHFAQEGFQVLIER
ncbi:type II toxin-antitoxin system VapC family toxin [Bythopirellula goksoeyrii]|uniref:Uncharacterized protein n=1 Tax=Bythopirellula goksoeyrii TaxID=1400387 RepID=A0A5B9Q7S5_9BACT|nr:PIN domain-containing protein [Bythopirellula goksoeyrii]QEG33625.1 hypothetical protein Pr1d_08890 [Bythopirellula goksoeyrii]